MTTLGRVPWPTLQAGWRTLVPLVVAGAAALVVAGALTAGATDAPPARTAAQLLADLDRVDVGGYSGTVVQKSTLLDPGTGATGGLSLARLMSGTNTIKVWYGGADRQRIAVLDATGESDLFRDGRTVWQWDSNSKIAIQSVSSAQDTVQDAPIPVDGTTVTPDDLARQAVAAIGPGTAVAVGAPGSIAGRSAYQLVLSPPADSSTRIGRVVLWLDGATRMPLAAQVYARGITREPSIDLSFTQIAFEVPNADTFEFVPPPGAVTQTYNSVAADFSSSADPLLGLRRTKTAGSGWTRVAIVTLPDVGNGSNAQDLATSQFGRGLTDVKGSWGTGKLLETNNGLLSMLFVDNGPIVVGSVDPSVLYAALG